MTMVVVEYMGPPPGQNEHLCESLKSVNEASYEDKDNGRLQQRYCYMDEGLPAVCPINFSCIIEN